MTESTRSLKKNSLRLFAILAFLCVILLIPDAKNNDIQKAAEKPFVWNRDEVWGQLERTFRQSKDADGAALDSKIENLSRVAEVRFSKLQGKDLSPGDSELLA